MRNRPFAPSNQLAALSLASLLLLVSIMIAPGQTSDFDKSVAAITQTLEQGISELRQGKELTAAERHNYKTAFRQHWSLLEKKYPGSSNYQIEEPDRSSYYLNAVRTACLSFETDGGWPFRSELALRTEAELIRRLGENHDLFTAFASLFPALRNGQTAYAIDIYEVLRRDDSFLANIAIEWSFTAYGDITWLAAHYLENNKHAEIDAIITATKHLDTDNALITMASLHELLADLPAAEATMQQINSVSRRTNALTALYSRHPLASDTAGTSFAQLHNNVRNRLFPDGVEKVTLAGLTSPPRNGIVFEQNNRNLSVLGLKPHDVVVAIDGCRITNSDQYSHIRLSEPDSDRMTLIFWNGTEYKEIDIWLKNRLFGVAINDYTP